ncbi:MAG TPA: hypothetical protein VF808_14770 [Ktedonobacterales bacterium]
MAETGLDAARGWARSAWGPAVVVAAALGALLGMYLALGGDARDFIHIGTRFLAQGGRASAVIRYDPSYSGYPSDMIGNDGQFCYYFALDPQHSPAYMDIPAYRLSRPLYPLLARALGLGQPALIPWTLLLLNWLAISATVLALGDILRRRGWSPWLATLYAAYPGALLALHADMTEPLAYALVALGLWLRERGVARVWLWSGLAFALAVLTREIAAAFPLALALGEVASGLRARGGARAAARPTIWLAAVMAPYLAWKVVVLVWTGSDGAPADLTPALYPFQGLVQQWPWAPSIWAAAVFVAIPGAVGLGLGAWALWRRPDAPEFWALALNCLFFCVLLRFSSWYLISAFRLSMGGALALLWAGPSLARVAGRARLWLAGVFTLWVSLAPLAAVTFFPALSRLLGAG